MVNKARPRTGEKRKTHQPLNMDRLPPLVLESILQLRNRAGKTWAEISALSAEPIGEGKLGFIEWAKLAPDVRKLFPKKRIPLTTLHRWFDLRVQQVSADVAVKSEQARAIAESFAKSMLVNGNEAVVNAARDTIMNVLAEDSSAAGRENAAAELRKLADVMQRARANDIRERKVATEERKIKLLEEREAIARTKLESEAAKLEKKHSKGQLKREDIARLVEMTFGIAPTAQKPSQAA
jgi:hypothetical protein